MPRRPDAIRHGDRTPAGGDRPPADRRHRQGRAPRPNFHEPDHPRLSGVRRFFGMEDTIERISFFRHAAQGLEERKQILYLSARSAAANPRWPSVSNR